MSATVIQLMATSKHLVLLGKALPHQTAGGLTGGKCLAKHMPKYEEHKSCSHRWQAFEKAVAEKAMYSLTDAQVRALGDGPWSLLFRGGGKVVSRLAEKGATAALSPENKGMYLHQVDKPGKGDWEVDRGKRNFKWDCNVPYYHEAHHVIPDATLRTALIKVFGAAVAVWVATKMLEAPYCVHHEDNMLILPMDQRVGEVLALPIHRETKQCSHSNYDAYVESRLLVRMQALQEQILEEHDKDEDTPKTKDLARAIEAEARSLYPQVAKARSQEGTISIEQFGRKMLSDAQASTGKA